MRLRLALRGPSPAPNSKQQAINGQAGRHVTQGRQAGSPKGWCQARRTAGLRQQGCTTAGAHSSREPLCIASSSAGPSVQTNQEPTNRQTRHQLPHLLSHPQQCRPFPGWGACGAARASGFSRHCRSCTKGRGVRAVRQGVRCTTTVICCIAVSRALSLSIPLAVRFGARGHKRMRGVAEPAALDWHDWRSISPQRLHRR